MRNAYKFIIMGVTFFIVGGGFPASILLPDGFPFFIAMAIAAFFVLLAVIGLVMIAIGIAIIIKQKLRQKELI